MTSHKHGKERNLMLLEGEHDADSWLFLPLPLGVWFPLVLESGLETTLGVSRRVSCVSPESVHWGETVSDKKAMLWFSTENVTEFLHSTMSLSSRVFTSSMKSSLTTPGSAHFFSSLCLVPYLLRLPPWPLYLFAPGLCHLSVRMLLAMRKWLKWASSPT
jgi:hypothetical protein